MKKTIIASLSLLAATPALAGHNNPWATADDTLLMQYHEENLLQSVDTPGEDEMLGVMVQNARGKLDDSIGTSYGGSAESGHSDDNGSSDDHGGSDGHGQY